MLDSKIPIFDAGGKTVFWVHFKKGVRDFRFLCYARTYKDAVQFFADRFQKRPGAKRQYGARVPRDFHVVAAKVAHVSNAGVFAGRLQGGVLYVTSTLLAVNVPTAGESAA